MNDDHRQRYARHIQLPNVGEAGQRAVLAATAYLEILASDSRAEHVAAEFLVASGVGELVLIHGSEAMRAELAARSLDTRVEATHHRVAELPASKVVTCSARPPWWPAARGDNEALAFFSGGSAAAQWLASVAGCGSDSTGQSRRNATRAGEAEALQIPDPLRAAVEDHARAAFPEECCGYLVGPALENSVDGIVVCRNAQADGEHPVAAGRSATTAFVFADHELFEFVRSFDSPRPARIVYHSHTNGQAYFSAVDREMAQLAGYPVQHLVVGVTALGVTQTAQFAWRADASDFVEVFRWATPVLR